MKGRVFCLAIIGSVWLGAGLPSASAQGDRVVSERFNISHSFYNECCDEVIEVTGTAHFVYNLRSGRYHYNYQNVVAQGSNGNTYHGTYVENSSFVDGEDGTYSGSGNLSIHFSSKGGCSFTVRILISWTWNSITDEYIEEVKKYEVECDGEADLG